MSGAAPRPILRYIDVHVRFGANVVFDHLNLEVREGEVMTLLGGSGTGKSVLLKVALGLIGWQSGSVIVDGEEIVNRDDTALLSCRSKVGMLFQSGALFDSLNVYENVAYPLRVRGMRDESSIAARVDEVLDMVGLPGVLDKLPAELSGGMRKRVALARAIAHAPKVLLYDEPTTGLDPINVRRISELIIELNRRLCVTSVCATHDLASAYMISDRLAMIADRHVAAIGTTEEMRASRDPTVQHFLTAMPVDGRSAR